MTKDDKLYLIHMLECIEHIQSYTREGRPAFFQSQMAQDAVLRNFEVIGEASRHVSSEFRESHAKVPWKKIAAFRNVLIHDYLGVDMGRVWEIIEQELPGLRLQLKQILAELP